ncbi:MAG: hypothetical protein KJO98_16085 [Rhodothermia bacterium]|nr:hypothetical protein [Rhodothermia bacterium]
MTDIWIVGPVTLDRIRDVNGEWRGPGGVAYYGSLAASRMGCSVGVSTVLARSHEDLLLAELREAGIDVQFSWSESTTTFVNSYLEGLDDRRQELIAKARPILPRDLSTSGTRLWYFGPLSRSDIATDSFEAARKRGGQLALDAQGLLRRVDGQRVVQAPNARLNAILSDVDFLKLTETELHAATGNSVAQEAMTELSHNGPQEIVVTMGSAGSLVMVDGRFLRIPSYYVGPLLDTTGCGDTYFATYLSARLQNEDPEWAGRLAAVAAALKATRRGGPTATRSQIERLAKRS